MSQKRFHVGLSTPIGRFMGKTVGDFVSVTVIFHPLVILRKESAAECLVVIGSETTRRKWETIAGGNRP